MPPFEAAGITLQTLVRALWKQRACWALLWLLATAAVLAAVWSLPRRYKAEALLAAEPAGPPGRGVVSPSDAELRAQVHLARLRVLQRERLLELLRQAWPELVAKWKPAEALSQIENWRERITISMLPESRGRFIGVRVVLEANDPSRGAAVTNRLAAELAREFERLSQPAAQASARQEANAAWARMTECQAALAAFEQEHGSDFESREKAILARLAALRADSDSNAQALRRAQAETARIELAISQSAHALPRSTPVVAPREHAPAETATVRQLRERLALLRARYKDSHPDVRRAWDELERAQALAAAETSPVETPAGGDGIAEEARREKLRAELDQARRRSLELEQESTRLSAEIAAQQEALVAQGNLRRQHAALRRECGLAEAAYRAAATRPPENRPGQAALRLVVLDQALPEGKAVRPNRRLLALLGALLALLPCGAIAAGREIGARPVLTLLGLAPPLNGHNGQSAVLAAAAGRVNGGHISRAG